MLYKGLFEWTKSGRLAAAQVGPCAAARNGGESLRISLAVGRLPYICTTDGVSFDRETGR